MSIFNEKDQYFKNCFSEQFGDSDSDNESETKVTNISAISEGKNTLDYKTKVNEPMESTPKSTPSNDDSKASKDTTKGSTKSEPVYITISSDDDTVDLNDDDDNCEIQEVIMTSHKSNQHAAEQPSSSSLNNSILDDEPMELKVMIAGEYKRFPTTYGSPLYDAFRSYIQDLRQSGKTLIITLNGKQVPLEQSALNLDINQGTILHGVECFKSMFTEPVGDTTRPEQASEDPNSITIKLQDGNQRNTREIKIGKTEPLIELKKRYAELLNIKEITSFRLKFDGDVVDEDETPIDLDLDGGEAFDVVRV